MSIAGQKIGFIGLGLMGEAMAGHILDAGADLYIYNRSPAKCQALLNRGAKLTNSPADMAQKVSGGIIIACVTDTPALETVITGPDGLINADLRDMVFIDMGTSAVATTKTLARTIEKLGAQYIDAPVSGGEVGARDANLSIMAGGAKAILDRAMPVFDILGQNTTHIGPVGAGQAAKAANQMIVGATLNIVAEALMLADAAGADMAATRDALLGGFAGSRILDLHGQRMIDQAFTPGGRASTQLKDLNQAADLAEQSRLDLAVLKHSRKQWQAMVDAGMGDLDQSGYFAFLTQQQEKTS